jgi:long-chain acyl-CoA synthetase
VTRSPQEEKVDRAIIDARAGTVAQQFLDRVQKTPSRDAYAYPSGSGWTKVTWKEVADRVERMAAGLAALGIEPEQRVALASSTRYEWVLADLAVMCAGAATTTVYPSTGAADVAYIVSDSQSRVVFAEDDAQLGKLREKRGELPDVVKVVLFDGTGDDDWVITLDELEKLGSEHLEKEPDVVAKHVAAIGPDSLATLVYTSGTTGQPKGVRLLHSSWTYVAAAIDAVHILDEDDVQFLWLPLAHVFGKVLLGVPIQIGFVTYIDGQVDKIVPNLADVRPTFMGAVPRIFEKAYGAVTTMMQKGRPVQRHIFTWAAGVGKRAAERRRKGAGVPPLLAAQHAIADKLVLGKVRERFGGNLKFLLSGSAGLNRDVAEFFDGAGIVILEGYGLTETCAAAHVGRPYAYELGTVGWAIPGTETKIADDGEVLLRGPGIMDGYHNQPDLTAEALTDGWFATGDIGEIDDDGFLRLTDRKKDLFKTSGGKYVAPSAIESQFKGVCPYASQLVVYGEGRKFVSALVTLDSDAIKDWAQSNGLADASYAEIATADATKKMVQGYLDELNGKLNHWEQIKQFAILDHELSVDDGELTPSLKVKRKVVTEKYADELDAMYA